MSDAGQAVLAIEAILRRALPSEIQIRSEWSMVPENAVTFHLSTFLSSQISVPHSTLYKTKSPKDMQDVYPKAQKALMDLYQKLSRITADLGRVLSQKQGKSA